MGRSRTTDRSRYGVTPPYKEMDAFVFTLERAQHADATTQAILVIPRTHFSDLESLVARNLWTRVDYYHKSSRNFFSRPDKTSAFQGTHESVSILGPNRRTLHSTVQHILILKLGTHSFRTLTLSCVPWRRRRRSSKKTDSKSERASWARGYRPKRRRKFSLRRGTRGQACGGPAASAIARFPFLRCDSTPRSAGDAGCGASTPTKEDF